MRLLRFASVLLVSSPILASAAGFSFTFDSDAQGWTKGNFGSTFATINTNSNGPATWSAGEIAGTDHSAYAYHFSPNLGGGHGVMFDTNLQFDFRSANMGGADPLVVLMSSTAFIVLEQLVTPSTTMDHYTIRLNNSLDWYYNSSEYYNGGSAVLASNAQIQSVLNDLQYIGISTDIAGGADNTHLDNVMAVPEPGTMLALSLGAVALIRRRRA